MAAGTVISGGFPGRVAQEVQPNPKCNGCLHYDGQAGRTGACLIGLRPWLCGDGEAQDIGYAPIDKGAGSYLPDMSNHGAHAPEVEAQHVSSMYGSGSSRPVSVQQVSLGEEHVHIVKGVMERHANLQKSMCRACSSKGAIGTGPANVDPQMCTCASIDARTIAKAIVPRMSNAQRLSYTADTLVEWVRDVVKAGFRLPVPKKARSLGGRVVAEKRGAEPAKKHPAHLSDQVLISDRTGGHLQKRAVKSEAQVADEGEGDDVEKGSFYHPPGRYDVSPAGGGKHHVDFHPKDGSTSIRVGTFESRRAARSGAAAHATRFASGSGRGGPSTSAPTRANKIASDAGGDAESVEKAIDDTKHSHIVTGKLAPGGRGYSNVKQARSAVDKLDNKYGAASHTYKPNPNYKPASSPTGAWRAKYPSGQVANHFGKAVVLGEVVHPGSIKREHVSHYVIHGDAEAGHTKYAFAGVAQKRADRLKDAGHGEHTVWAVPKKAA